MATSRLYDVVVLGASGAVGRACSKYLQNAPSQPAWAAAARSKDRTLQILANEGLADPTFVRADVTDYESLVSMTRDAKVVLNCAGPFARYGENVIKACIETGTDYCDITGEIHWVEAMKRRYDTEAQAQGVRIVSMVGFDCIPADVLVNTAVRTLADNGYGKIGATTLISKSKRTKGVIPPGTFETMLMMATKGFKVTLDGGKGDDSTGSFMVEAEQRKLMKRSLAGGYILPLMDPVSKRYVPSFMMRSVNTKCVHWSASVLGYGDAFTFKEFGGAAKGSIVASYARALFANVSVIMFLMVMKFSPSSVVERIRSKVAVADPGPNGYTKSSLHAVNADNTAVVDIVSEYAGDAGTQYTAMTSCQGALSLASSKREAPTADAVLGWLPPTVALGPDFIKDLEAVGVSVKITHGAN